MVKFTFFLIFSVFLSRCCVQSASVCTIFEFRCPSGKCIPSDWRCNDRKDCRDGSDELSCNNALPGKIAKFKVVPKDETSVIVSWVPVVNTNSPPVVSFQLRYKEVSSHIYASVVLQRFLRSFVVKNLRPLGLYEFTISATNKVGVGPQSDVVLARVKPQETEEPSLQGVPLNSSAILLSWNNTSETPTLGYFIYYKKVMEDESENGLTLTISTIKRRALLTKGIKEGKTYRIRVQPFTIHGYGPIIGPVLVKTPAASVKPPDFMVSIDRDSLHYQALLTVEPATQGKSYALRFGKSVTKSLPVIEEKVTLLSPNFSGGHIRIEAFLWHYFGLSMQGDDGRWSQENFKWLRGPLQGYSGISNAPDSVTLFWSQIDQDTNPDTYLVSFKASDELTKSKILVRNENNLGYTRAQIGSLRADTMYDFEISKGDAKCDSLKKIGFSVKTMSKEPLA